MATIVTSDKNLIRRYTSLEETMTKKRQEMIIVKQIKTLRDQKRKTRRTIRGRHNPKVLLKMTLGISQPNKQINHSKK